MRSPQTVIKRPLLTEKSARLRETGRALDEQVAIAEQCDQHAVQELLLPDDQALQVGFEPQKLLL